MLKKVKKTLSIALAVALILQFFVLAPPSANAALQAQRGTYLRNVATLERTADNTFLITTVANEKVQVIFYSADVFRIWMANNGTGAFADPAWRTSNTTEGRTPMIATLDLGPVPRIELVDQGTYFELKSATLTLRVNKAPATFALYSAEGAAIWEEDAPLDYGSSTFQTLKTSADEHFYGGGVQQGSIDFKGRTMNISQSGWVENQSSNPAPFYISSKGYGAFRHSFQNGAYNFTSGVADLRQSENRFDCFYFYGPSIAKVVDGYTSVTGRPHLIPRWALGLGEFNIYKNSDGSINTPLVLPLADQYLAKDMPLSHFVVNDGYMPQGNRGYTELPYVTQELNKRGYQSGLWTSQGLGALPWEVATGGIRAQKLDVGWVGSAYDFGLNGGRLASEGMEQNSDDRAYVIQCCGWAGTQRYATVWTGDQSSNWDYVRYHISTVAGAGLSGFAYTTSDLDSIYSGSAQTYTRDLQWKTFIPTTFIMSGWSGNALKQPWFYGEPYTTINRNFLKLKQALTPYQYSYAYKAEQTGAPIVRSMFYEFPDDPNTYGNDTQYQFMSGEHLLVAPVYESKTVRDNIYLPAGRWIDYWTGKNVYGGGTINGYAAPMSNIPVFVRAGAIIPTYPNYTYDEKTPVDLVSFDIYPEGKTTFNLFEDDGKTRAYKSGAYMMTNITSDAPAVGKSGTLTVTIDAAQGKAYTGMAHSRQNELAIHASVAPASVSLGGVKLTQYSTLAELKDAKADGWFFDAAEKGGVLHVFTASRPISEKKVFTVDGYTVPSADTRTRTLPVPTDMYAIPNSSTQVRMTWGPVAGATSYDLEMDGVVYLDATSPFVQSKQTPGSTHKYRVRAVNALEESPWSAYVYGCAGDDISAVRLPASAVSSITGPIADQGFALANMTDNKTDTYFNVSYANMVPLTFIFDKQYPINEIRYLPRQDDPMGAAGTILGYRVLTSLDGTKFTLVSQGTWDKDSIEKAVKFPTVLAKAVRIEKFSSVDNLLSGAEVSILRDPGNQFRLKDYALNKPISASSEWVTDAANYSKIPTAKLTATSTNTEPGAQNRASNAVDGDAGTVWHTRLTNDSFPAELVIDLGGDYRVGQIKYLPRASGSSGNITKYAISVLPVGTSNYQLVAGGDWADDGLEKVVQFRTVRATKIKLTSYAGVQDHSAASEVSVYCKTADPGAMVKFVPKVDFNYSASSQIDSQGIAYAFDGKAETYWDSDYNNKSWPQYVTMAFPAAVTLKELAYTPRATSANGRMLKYNVLTADSATGPWTSVATGSWANDATVKKITFSTPLVAKFFRLQADDATSVNATGHLCIAEIELTGSNPATTQEEAQLVPKSDFTYAAASDIGGVNSIDAAFNGNTGDYYDSNYNVRTWPQWISMSLIKPAQLTKLVYYPRTSGSNGRMLKYDLLTSTDGNTWEQKLTGTWANDATPKTLDLTGLSGKTQYIRLQATDTTYVYATGHLCAAEIMLYHMADPVTLEDAEPAVPVTTTYTADKANDGRAYTMWSSSSADAQTIIVDLEQTVDITQVNLNWSNNYPRNFTIASSADGSQWMTNYYGNGFTGGNVAAYVGANARYVRVATTGGSADGTGISLISFEVYGLDTQADITPKTADFYKLAPENLPITLTLNGFALQSVKNGAATLTAGTDYAADGNTLTISKEYLAAQPLGRTALDFQFDGSPSRQLVVNVIGADRTALLAAIARFEALKVSLYVDSSYAIAKAAYDAAVLARDDKNLLQPAVDTAASILNNAIDNLITKGTVLKIDGAVVMSLKRGRTMTVPTTTNAYGPLTYTSSNTAVASVTPDGVVTGLKAGMTTIVVSTTDGSKLTAKVVITVVS